MMQTINEKQVNELWTKVSSGEDCQIVDVREPIEYQAVHIANSKSIPLSKLNTAIALIEKDKPVYLICHSGPRAVQAAAQLTQLGFKELNVIKGGLDAWIKSGYSVVRDINHVWTLDRQVRFTAGLLILAGIALAYTVSATWICLSAFVALGMVFSSVTDTCGMGIILARMPWNQACNK